MTNENHVVWLRLVDAGTDNECWFVCNRCDPGAIPFIPESEITRPAEVGGGLELADARRAFWLVVAAAGGSKGVSVPRNIVEDYDERTASIRFVETHGGYTWFAETSTPPAPGSEVRP